MNHYGMFTDEANRVVGEAVDEWVEHTGIDGIGSMDVAISEIRELAAEMGRIQNIPIGEVYDTAVGDAIYGVLDYRRHPERAARAETAKFVREVLEASGHWDKVRANEQEGVVYMQNEREVESEWLDNYRTVVRLRIEV